MPFKEHGSTVFYKNLKPVLVHHRQRLPIISNLFGDLRGKKEPNSGVCIFHLLIVLSASHYGHEEQTSLKAGYNVSSSSVVLVRSLPTLLSHYEFA